VRQASLAASAGVATAASAANNEATRDGFIQPAPSPARARASASVASVSSVRRPP
jgi:hypothetical protein